MSQALAHSPADEADHRRGEGIAAAKRVLMGDETCRIDVACDGMRLALGLHEDTGLIVV